MTDSVPSAVEIQRQYYTNTADSYDKMHLMDAEHNRALRYISMVMRDRGLSSILDVGCGTGRGVKYLMDHGLNPIGVDPVQALLDTGCREHGLPPERMIYGSGDALSFNDASFDATVELGVLHHVPNPTKLIDEMIRVSRHAIFVSDCNRFGQGSYSSRLVKIAAWKLGLWKSTDWIRTRGKGYTISKGDGLAYSYSVYDSFVQLAKWADEVQVIGTSPMTGTSWLHPLATCSHALLVAIKH